MTALYKKEMIICLECNEGRICTKIPWIVAEMP